MTATVDGLEVRDGAHFQDSPLHEVRRSPWRRVSVGHVLMVFAGLLGMVATIVVLRQPVEGREVLVASRSIRVGEALTRNDVRVERVRAGRSVIAGMLERRELGVLGLQVAVAPIGEGEAISRRAVRPRAADHGRRSMSVPIDPARAVSGRLAAGDRVDVIDAQDHQSSIIVADAEVLAVDERGRAGIGEATSPFTVTIAVDASESQALAAAIEGGGLSIARTTGARSSQGDGAPDASSQSVRG